MMNETIDLNATGTKEIYHPPPAPLVPSLPYMPSSSSKSVPPHDTFYGAPALILYCAAAGELRSLSSSHRRDNRN